MPETDPRQIPPSPTTAPRPSIQPEVLHPDELKLRLQNLIAEAEANEAAEPFAILYIDLDGMKAANTAYGDAGGDELIRLALETLGSQLRYTFQPTDEERRAGASQLEDEIFQIIDDRSVSRLHPEAGDEFIVLLKSIRSAEILKAITERIQNALSSCQTTPESELDVAPQGIRSSIGGRLYQLGDSAESMITAAEEKMKVQKDKHKDDELLEAPEPLQAAIVRLAGVAIRENERDPALLIDGRAMAAMVGAAIRMYRQGGPGEIRRKRLERRRERRQKRQQNDS